MSQQAHLIRIMRLQTFRQLFLPSTPLHLTRISNRDFSSSPPSPPETKTKAKSSPATKGGKKERGEVKRPSELLPQSPLIANPRLVDPGSYKKRKRRADPSELQDLRNNPWAVALTSPIRYCAATKTRIPVAFMGDWGLVQEDGSDALWMLPVGLLGPELGGTRMDAQKEGQGQGQGQSEGVNAGGGDGAKKKQLPAEPTQSRRALTLRMVDRVPIIKEFSASFSRENKSPEARSSAVRLFPSDWKYPRGPITAKHEKRVVWRKDMPEFLLEKLRRMVLEKVTKAAGRWKRTGDGHGAWTPFDLDSDAHGSDALVEGLKRLGSIEKMESGGVLVIGSPSKNTSIPVEGEQLHLLFRIM
ncbi:hypothetical protein PHISCL_03037 [Aspergillus sclerotialis]|uniref:Uncharacterized protein n=1 Tax=Aspergillus sclerotialis TaxID=2070753 RepID=A0A3A2ZQN2_9EURO|nr:hypothetical protein PHISCL_03037 [Aspergillus sclerotialis]